MEAFLRKQKLIDSISLNLNCDKTTFIEKFRENVEQSDLSFSPFEAFNSRNKTYKGNISNSTFKIQKIKTFFSGKKQHPIATGKITENIDSIKLEIEINGINPFIKFFFIFTGIFYLIFLSGFLFITTRENFFPFFIIPFLFLHAALMIGIPFFMIKSSVKNFKQEIEREFHFWLK